MDQRIETARDGCIVRTDRPEDAFAVRRAVFVEEQGYADEFDARDDDPACIHLALYADGRLAGCARITSLALERRVPSSDPAMPASPLDDGAAPAWSSCILRNTSRASMLRTGTSRSATSTTKTKASPTSGWRSAFDERKQKPADVAGS